MAEKFESNVDSVSPENREATEHTYVGERSRLTRGMEIQQYALRNAESAARQLFLTSLAVELNSWLNGHKYKLRMGPTDKFQIEDPLDPNSEDHSYMLGLHEGPMSYGFENGEKFENSDPGYKALVLWEEGSGTNRGHWVLDPEYIHQYCPTEGTPSTEVLNKLREKIHSLL